MLYAEFYVVTPYVTSRLVNGAQKSIEMEKRDNELRAAERSNNTPRYA
jgi:hypothetical protein